MIKSQIRDALVFLSGAYRTISDKCASLPDASIVISTFPMGPTSGESLKVVISYDPTTQALYLAMKPLSSPNLDGHIPPLSQLLLTEDNLSW